MKLDFKNTFQTIKNIFNDVTDVESHLSKTWKVIVGFSRFVYNTSVKFVDDYSLHKASALAYTTLLSLVPMVAVSFAVFTAFKTFESFKDKIQQAIFSNLIPTHAEVVWKYISQFSENIGTLSVVGLATLVVTATSALRTLENCMNDIWKVRKNRTFISRIVIYWSVITLTPILIAVSFYMSSSIKSLPVLSGILKTPFVSRIFDTILPFFFSWIGFFLIYELMPYTRVELKSAMIGGAVGSVLWEASKHGFSYYVSSMASYSKVYGSLSVLPVFLMWLYITWLIILFGGEVSYFIQNPLKHFISSGRMETEKKMREEAARGYTGLKVMLEIARAFKNGEVGVNIKKLEKATKGVEEEIRWAINRFKAKGLVSETEDGRYIPAKPLEDVKFDDVLQGAGMTIPKPLRADQTSFGEILKVPLGEIVNAIKSASEPFDFNTLAQRVVKGSSKQKAEQT